ncbi:MAG TPA: class I SAM-dependent methyltransferase [Candidatus Polarisedimenticolia bacterium]|nr:class I SAM-dependent methyltransferase [Candidatus Polarisedimenticolia bacterium]
MSQDLETLIFKRFDDLAETAMFPQEMQPDDFELVAVLDGLGDVRGRLILDLGCAKGRFVRALASLGARVVGADPTWKLLAAASKSAPGGAFVLSSATRLPFADSRYDGVVCVEVIEHIPEIDTALAEIARVLKPGGKAVIIDKNPIGIGWYRFYPNWLYKAVMERMDRWSYPRDFPFKERWHSSWSLKRRLRAHFTHIEIKYLDGRVQGRRRQILAPLFRLIPILRPDVAWCCRK